jgi:RNA polymerase subunit RPABC4/transcription elongation factor Spt4
MTFDPSSLGNFMLILTSWGGAFLAALWLSLIVWTYRDIRARARDPLGRILAVLVVAVLFLPGILIYLIIRPLRTLEDEYQRTLEEEALLQDIEDVPVCPGCGRHTKEPWKICPNCHTRLKKTCHQCGKLMELPWNLCPFCGTPTPGRRRENLTMDDALEPLAGISLNDSDTSEGPNLGDLDLNSEIDLELYDENEEGDETEV